MQILLVNLLVLCEILYNYMGKASIFLKMPEKHLQENTKCDKLITVLKRETVLILSDDRIRKQGALKK